MPQEKMREEQNQVSICRHCDKLNFIAILFIYILLPAICWYDLHELASFASSCWPVSFVSRRRLCLLCIHFIAATCLLKTSLEPTNLLGVSGCDKNEIR
jgi:hypothetical protein